MEEIGKEYIVTDKYLTEVINKVSTTAVGKIMKRFDVVEDRAELKKVVKELVYEEFRNLKSFIQAINWGIKFVKRPSKQ